MNYAHYEIVKKLGSGMMGEVYQARDPYLDKMIALKVLRKDRVTSEDSVKRFLSEAKFIGRLKHQNIVEAYYLGQDHGTIFIAMELLEGTPLNKIITGGTLSMEEVVRLGIQIADALDYAHKENVIHRDIKPPNIIVTPEGQVKITDFGIARLEDADATQLTQAGDILGTPAYMSPEQVNGEATDGRTDLYSLGVILYELSTGKKPFVGGNLSAVFLAIMQETPLHPVKINPAVHPSVSKLIMKCLNKNPVDRYQTGKSVKEALNACLETMAPQKALPSVSSKRSWKKNGALAIILVAAVFLAIFIPRLISNEGFKTDKNVKSQVVAAGPEKPKPVFPKKQSLLSVKSKPAGARVFVNDKEKGATPLNARLDHGEYIIRLSLPDYDEWEATVELGEAENIPLFVRLIPLD